MEADEEEGEDGARGRTLRVDAGATMAAAVNVGALGVWRVAS